ncbi:maltoporin [Photobacterium swingsii]|uniref:maltoporin n=1 Tax=Photobacterium swingsii TaxID=680026 RepID=UPI00352D0B37
MSKICLTAAAVSAALVSASAMASDGVDFHGYMRAGAGISGDNGGMISQAKNGIGRLGNENDAYGEIGLGKEVYNQDGKSFYLDSMLAGGSTSDKLWSGQNPQIVQFNAQAKGLIESDADAVIWAGKRYYQRHDIHITDFYYWNTSGAGGGVENLTAGPGKLSLAWIRDDVDVKTAGDEVVIDQDKFLPDGTTPNPNYGKTKVVDKQNSTSVNNNIIDVRYAGLGLWENGSLELGVNAFLPNEAKSQDLDTKSSYMFTAELTQGDLFGGFNKTVLQYGTNGSAEQMTTYGAGMGVKAVTNADKGYRLINWGVAAPSEKIEIGHQLMYANTSFKENQDDHSVYSIVVRPMYKWNDTMRTIVEAGYTAEKNADLRSNPIVTDGDAVLGSDLGDKALSKFTVAQAWSAGSSFWARPEIRVFASYITDHENDNAFGDSKSEYNVGIQAEAWW